MIASIPNNSLIYIIKINFGKYLYVNKPQFSEGKIEFMSGSLGSFCSLMFLVPTDLLKCRAQMNEGKTDYRKEIKDIFRRQGYQGVYRGFWATFWRDVPGWGLLFYLYALIKKQEKKVAVLTEKFSQT